MSLSKEKEGNVNEVADSRMAVHEHRAVNVI